MRNLQALVAYGKDFEIENIRLASLISEYPFLGHASFIIGTGRCGSTLLRSLFDSHPDLILWPFEFSYYTLFQNYACSKVEVFRVSDLLRYFTKKELYQLHGYSGDLAGINYTLHDFSPEQFFLAFECFKDELVNRKEFLQLIMYSYARGCEKTRKPIRFLVTVNQPCKAMLEDFPEAKYLASIRHPVQTYVSRKRFYFKGADFQMVDRCAVYRPGAANSGYRWGLLETAMSPIMYTYEWLNHNFPKKLLFLKLEDLQQNPEFSMKTTSDFLGINWDSCLLNPTFLGGPHQSNLSSGKESAGTIVKENVRESAQYIEELTYYEFAWACRLLEPYCRHLGYDSVAEFNADGFFSRSFWKPLKNEFPSWHSVERKGKSFFAGLWRYFLRWVFAIIGYLANRWIFLTYSIQSVIKSWPYAK